MSERNRATIRLEVVDRAGQVHEIDARPEGSLMQTLRDLDLGVAAICGGMCSCATCHVHLAPAWAGRLAPPQSEEIDLLGSLTFRSETSRLACQILLSRDLDGLSLALATEE